MPFDATKLRQPTVTTLPPRPPARGGGPRRIHLVIEIVNQPAQRTRRPSIGLWLLFFLALIAIAHAQPSRHQAPQPQQPAAIPPWPGGSYSYPDSSGTIWTFPNDQAAGNGGHGCKTQTGGDGVTRTDCW